MTTDCVPTNWPIDKIRPYPANAKMHKAAWIEASIREFGFDQPVVVDAEGVIIKGHGRVEAARKLGYVELPVIVRADLTEEQTRLARIADNRSADGGWDWIALRDEIQQLGATAIDLDTLGITENWWKKLDAPEVSALGFSSDVPGDSREREPGPERENVLAIVLDAERFHAWEGYKASIGERDDAAALMRAIGVESEGAGRKRKSGGAR